ncbi:MAG: glucose 1-dehydrogenase [Rhizomicrobium sp.]
MGRVSGKVAIVTGGTRGMGPHHARVLVAEGAKVVVTSRASEEQGRALEAELGEACTFMRQDVAVEADWERVVAETERRYGPVSVLVNNAGVTLFRRIAKTTVEDFHSVTDVNQLGVLLGTKHVAPSMQRAGGGSIINISSASGLKAAKSSLIYGATKWAVRGMTRTAAVELAPRNIRVNAVFPGFTISDMFAGGEELEKWLLPEIPLGRFAGTEECSPLVLFLASDESRYCTGADFVIDGGYSIR